MTDASGVVVWAADYKPFGEATITVNTITNNLRFPGMYSDQETGLYYNYFRDYDPVLGRYPQADPIGLVGGINPYRYVINNPINFIDPKGLLMICSQTRIGTNTTISCSDPTTNSNNTYNLTEPAPFDPSDPYGPGQQLAPGIYNLLPRPTQGTVLPQGSPIYTTPGQQPGTIITPSGGTRGGLLEPVGPHVGTSSSGCPLFPKTPAGKNQKNNFYNAFNANVNNGGTIIWIISWPGYAFGGQ